MRRSTWLSDGRPVLGSRPGIPPGGPRQIGTLRDGPIRRRTRLSLVSPAQAGGRDSALPPAHSSRDEVRGVTQLRSVSAPLAIGITEARPSSACKRTGVTMTCT